MTWKGRKGRRLVAQLQLLAPGKRRGSKDAEGLCVSSRPAHVAATILLWPRTYAAVKFTNCVSVSVSQSHMHA
jgi:hypothetical protein